MKDAFRFMIVLGIICAVFSGALYGVNLLTEKNIKQNQAKKKLEALAKLFPGKFFAKSGSPVPKPYPVHGIEIEAYSAYDDKECARLYGVSCESRSPGYGGNISLMVGMDTRYRITRVEVMEHKETPGIGDRINKVEDPDRTLYAKILGRTVVPEDYELRSEFLEQFDGVAAHAITGATEPAKSDTGAKFTFHAITGATISSTAVHKGVKKAARQLRDVLSQLGHKQ